MKKLTIGFVLVLLATQLLKAQPIEVKWGEENKLTKNSRNQHIIGETEEFLFTFNKRPRGLFRKETFSFLKFNKKDGFKLKTTVSFKLPKRKNERLSYKNSLMVDGHIIFLFNSWHKKNKTNTLLAQKVSYDGKVDKKLLELGTSEPRKGLFKDVGRFDVKTNENRDKLIVVQHLAVSHRNASEAIEIGVYNGDFSEDWKAKFDIPFTDINFDIYRTDVDSEGNAFILGKKYDEVKKVNKKGKVKVRRKLSLVDKEVSYEFALLYYNKNTKEVKDYRIDLKDKHIIDIDIKVRDKEDIVVGGFFLPKSIQWVPSVKGTFFVRINKASGKIVSQSQKEFDDKFLNTVRDGKVYSWLWTSPSLMFNEFIRGKDVTRKGALKNIRMTDFEMREDGSAVIVGESYRVVVKAAGEDENNYYYYYDDIIVVNIDPNGNISWSARVPKKQISVNDDGYYSSYFMKIDGDDIYFVFNDRKSNNKRIAAGKKAAYLKYPRNSSATLVKITKDGEMTREKLFTNKDFSSTLVPKETARYQNYQSGISIMFGLNIKWYHIFGGQKYRYGSIEI